MLIKGGTVVTAEWIDAADVLIDGETIKAVGTGLDAPGVELVDATDRFVLPGGIDVHTHLAMPLGDISSSDDFYTGHVAAAFGGTTTHLDFANQSKGESLQAALDEWHARARDKACIDYGFHITVTDVN
ncbi:MAG TPA: dihydropyrimidinase, partial [Chloroflexota bacterium]|nr:dihydropyrimidinase [Chloroflexota bacterium]